MYFDTVKTVLDAAISAYASANGIEEADVCEQIGQHLVDMSKQHREDDPSIPYEDPLCRLAYIYRHVGANATLFERALLKSPYAREVFESRAGKKLRICAVGGGPGSELLGLTKFIDMWASPETWPKRVDFILLDLVSEWGESWHQLAECCEQRLEEAAARYKGEHAPPILSPSFHIMDVTDEESYKNFAWLFSSVDIVIFNYIISENIDGLDDLKSCLELIVKKANPGAAFLFIDRKEFSERINNWVLTALPDVGLEIVGKLVAHGGYMDSGEQINPDLGDYPELFAGHPRVSFQTSRDKNPTAFSITAKKTTGGSK